jgi:hypothetical protein
LSETKRNGTSITVTEDLVKMLAEQEPPAWAQFVDNMDIERDYYVTFAAFLATVFSLVLPWFAVNFIISTLANAFLPADEGNFITNLYLPEIHEATKDVIVTHDQQVDIVYKFLGMMMKILWSFIFQEHVMSFMSFLYGPAGLTLA